MDPRLFFERALLHPIALVGLWIVVQLLMGWHYGVVCSSDSDFYIANAQALLDGRIENGRNLWYLGYAFFLAVIFYFHGSLFTVVILQVLISGLSAWGLYRLTIRVSNARAAYWATVFYLCWLPVQQWNYYLYTESLFTSCCILSLVAMAYSHTKGHYMATALLIVFTVLIRPTGIAFLMAICFTGYVSYSGRSLKKDLLLLALGASAFFFAVNLMLEEYIFYFIESYRSAEIIYPEIPLLLSVPSQLYVPSPDRAPLLQLVCFIAGNPFYFLKLFLVKSLLFIGNMKPYFSIGHNLAIAFFLYPCYAFAGIGFKKMQNHPLKTIVLSYILLTTGMVGMTSENWDGRFLVPLLPLVFVFSAHGLHTLFYRMKLNN